MKQAHVALQQINSAREDRGLEALSGSNPLDTVARKLIETGKGDQLISPDADLFELLPRDRRNDWRQLKVLAAACGGCGTQPTADDVRHFTGQWLQNDQYTSSIMSRAATHLGFAMKANGEGGKTAVAVIGQRR